MTKSRSACDGLFFLADGRAPGRMKREPITAPIQPPFADPRSEMSAISSLLTAILRWFRAYGAGCNSGIRAGDVLFYKYEE